MSLGVVRCNSNSLLMQRVGRRGQYEKQRQLKKDGIELYFMTHPVVVTFMVHEKSVCPLICMFVYLFIYLFMYPTIRFFRYNRPSPISQPDTELTSAVDKA